MGGSHGFTLLQEGKDCKIGNRVRIAAFPGSEAISPIVIGDSVVIHDDVTILAGPEGVQIGDGTIVHNHCLLGGPGPLHIGVSCWIGQHSVLDSTGGLWIGNCVTIGYSCHVWTHVARLPKWRRESKPVVLEDEVWLVGDTVTVNPGVRMRRGSAALAHAVVTKDTKPGRVYAGVPAKLKRGVRLRG